MPGWRGIAGCGGGGGGQPSFTGIDRLGVSSGTITGFGSIFVNGVEWRTTGAGIEVDGQPGTEADLQLGQGVVVRGKLDAGGKSGRADSVAAEGEVEGPVAAIDTAAGTLVVLGQTVRVVTATVFAADIAGGLAGLVVGDGVEVSGYRDSTGVIRATRIERQEPGDEAGVKGRISGLDPGNQRIMIGSLVVDYAAATLEDFGGEDPSPQANDMLAVCVQREDLDDEAVLRGPIQSIAQPELTVLGVTISTDTALFRDASDNPMSAAAFFAAVSTGDVIEASTDAPAA